MSRQTILRYLGRFIAGLAVIGAIIVLVSEVSNLSGRIQTQQDRLSTALQAQTQNRVSNVARWCSALNHDRRVLVSYAALAAQQHPYARLPPLGLKPLPCKRLESATRASTHPRNH